MAASDWSTIGACFQLRAYCATFPTFTHMDLGNEALGTCATALISFLPDCPRRPWETRLIRLENYRRRRSQLQEHFGRSIQHLFSAGVRCKCPKYRICRALPQTCTGSVAGYQCCAPQRLWISFDSLLCRIAAVPCSAPQCHCDPAISVHSNE